MSFKPGNDYNNVYFMKIDAKKHSQIVEHNDSDKVDQAFDEFETTVYKAVDDASKDYRCEYAEFWGWEGDGGLCILYDAEESKARKTALATADTVLEELPSLNARLLRRKVKGVIHVRIAIHKGTIRYKGDDKRGSIHSKELNFCSHLEKVVPQDSLAVSNDVYVIMGDEQVKFRKTQSKFEEKEIYLKSFRDESDLMNEWKSNIAPGVNKTISVDSDVPVSEIGLTGVYSQRAVGGLYPSLLRGAEERIWALGIGLGGFQADHQQALIDKGKQGVDIRLLIADPKKEEISIICKESQYTLPAWRDFETGLGEYNSRNINTLKQLVIKVNQEIEKDLSSGKKLVNLRLYKSMPTFALLLVDSDLFISPYTIHIHNSKMATLSFKKGGRLFDQFVDHFNHIWNSSAVSRDALSE